MKIFSYSLLAVACVSAAFPLQAAQTCNSRITLTTPDSDFTLHDDATVTHLKTGLIWKRCAEGQTWSGTTCSGNASALNWADALAQAKASTFNGHTDWRLPNKNELVSLVERACYSPAINLSVFPSTPSSYFWSGSPFANFSDYAWYVGFDDGNAGSDDARGLGEHVRLVRGGQSFAFCDLNGVCEGDTVAETACGVAEGVMKLAAPTAGLCSTGTATAISTSATDYNWTCGSSSCQAPRGYKVSAKAGNNGSVSPATQTVLYNQATSISVIPAAGYGAQVSGCGGSLVGTTYTTGPITYACGIQANFSLRPILTVIRVGNGVVSSTSSGINCGVGTGCIASYPAATSVQLIAAPSAGNVFSRWGGACTGTNTSCNVMMNGAKTVSANFGLNKVGTAAANTLNGAATWDVLLGNGGNDVLNGKGGNDTLTGGTGKDIFVFDTALDGTFDRIADFKLSDDRIRLSRTIFTDLPAGSTLSATLFAKGSGMTTPPNTTARLLYNTTTGNLYYVKAGVAIKFANLVNKVAITGSHFTVQ